MGRVYLSGTCNPNDVIEIDKQHYLLPLVAIVLISTICTSYSIYMSKAFAELRRDRSDMSAHFQIWPRDCQKSSYDRQGRKTEAMPWPPS